MTLNKQPRHVLLLHSTFTTYSISIQYVNQANASVFLLCIIQYNNTTRPLSPIPKRLHFSNAHLSKVVMWSVQSESPCIIHMHCIACKNSQELAKCEITIIRWATFVMHWRSYTRIDPVIQYERLPYLNKESTLKDSIDSQVNIFRLSCDLLSGDGVRLAMINFLQRCAQQNCWPKPNERAMSSFSKWTSQKPICRFARADLALIFYDLILAAYTVTYR